MTELAEIFTVVTGAIAVALFLASTGFVARWIISIRLTMAKLRICRALVRTEQMGKARARNVSAAWRQAKGVTAGEDYSVADELQWLSNLMRVSSSFSLMSHQSKYGLKLVALYRRYAANLQVRTLLLGGSQPILEHVAEVAHRTADLVERNANNVDVSLMKRKDSGSRSTRLRTGYVSSRRDINHTIPSTIFLEQFEVNSRVAAHDLRVSWIKEKSLAIAPRIAGDKSRLYNGLLPKLMQYRFEQDVTNGNYRLHVELGEIYYSEYLASSAPDEQDSEPASPEGLLTLSVLPLTRDGYFIIAERGDLSVYPGCWGPGAGGNLEIPRLGSDVEDIDRDGIIDPLLAIAREAKEELGLTLFHSQILAIGLGRIANSEETGTWLLPTIAATDLSVEEVSLATLSADAVSGRWEVGTHLAAVPVPQSPDQAYGLVSWAMRNENVMPHLTISILKLVSLLTMALRPEEIPSHRSDQDELPPGAVKFRFGQSLECFRPE